MAVDGKDLGFEVILGPDSAYSEYDAGLCWSYDGISASTEKGHSCLPKPKCSTRQGSSETKMYHFGWVESKYSSIRDFGPAISTIYLPRR
jgi:hypothetical protein